MTQSVQQTAKTFKILLSIGITIIGILYGISTFVYDAKHCTVDIEAIRHELDRMKKDSNDKHRSMEEKIQGKEKSIQMGLAGLKVSLARISTDLQFIKEQLIRKGLGNGK